MANKINISELLKDCPTGMELDCTMYDNLYFDSLNADYYGTINCYTLINGIKTSITFTKYGTFNNHTGAKCVIFPKGKTSWEGFVPPCKFKDGDIVSTMNGIWIGIVKKPVNSAYEAYVTINGEYLMYNNPIFCFERFATEEEKARLFQVIKDSGCNWNPETKTLNKSVEPKFKIGDKIKLKGGDEFGFITQVTDCFYTIKNKNRTHYLSIKKQDDWELINKPKFKVGNTIRNKNSGVQKTINKMSQDCYECNDGYDLAFENQDNWELVTSSKPKFKVGDTIKFKEYKYKHTITKVCEDHYELDDGCFLKFDCQDKCELVSINFDFSKLVPFESKVLVRNDNEQRWIPAFWGGKREDGYVTTFGWSKYCVPYEGNEHLLRTSE